MISIGFTLNLVIKFSVDVKSSLLKLSANSIELHTSVSDLKKELYADLGVLKESSSLNSNARSSSLSSTTSDSPLSLKEAININLKHVGSNIVKGVEGIEKSLIVVPKNDEYMGPSVLHNGHVWEEELLKQMLVYAIPGSNVVDIGANYGSYSIFFSKKVGPLGKVWAFEPQPYIHRILCTNLILNDLMNVQTMQSSLGHKETIGHMSATLSDGSKKGQTFETVQEKNEPINYGGRQIGAGGERININKLDSFSIKNISLLKVDAEGAEMLVFWGAKETIRREKPVIFGETNYQKLSPDVLDSLDVPEDVRKFNIKEWAVKELGYTIKYPRNNHGAGDWILLPPGKL